jgi:hypothetical protein
MDLGKVGRMVNGGDRQQPPPPFASLHYEQFARANRDNKSFVASLLTPSTIVFMFELFLARTVDNRRTQFKLLYESPNVMECVPCKHIWYDAVGSGGHSSLFLSIGVAAAS